MSQPSERLLARMDRFVTTIGATLSAPQRKIVDAAMGYESATRAEIAAATEYSEGSGGFNNLIGSLCTLDILEKPAPGSIAVSAWAREVLS